MNRGRILIIASSFLYSSSTIYTSYLAKRGLSSLDISFFFTFLSVLPFIPFVANRKLLKKIKDHLGYVIIYSFISVLLILSIFESIVLGLSPGIVSLLTYTQPFWTIIFGRLLFGEKIVSRKIGLIVVAFVGIFLITNPIGSPVSSTVFTNPNSSLPVEYALAIFSGVCLSLWVILAKKGSANGFEDPVELTFVIRSGSAALLFLTGLISRFAGITVFFANFSSVESNFVFLLLFSLLTGLSPDLLFYSGVKSVSALQAGLILLLEPVSTAIASVSLKIATFNGLQIIGGILILVVNYFALISSDRDQMDDHLTNTKEHERSV
jgi:drug/metabolite transporter (DMT)-like permease